MTSYSEVWQGPPQIVVALDIGITTSQVAYAFLETGSAINVHRVTNWPGLGARGTYGKVPTVVLYDSDQMMVSAGGEALTDEAKETTEDNDWTLISNFPLHLYPSSARNNLPKLQRVSTALPPGLSLSAIYSDFLKYLIDQTHRNFSDRIVDGSRIAGQHWKDMTIAFKLHFSWSIKEQDFIREAFLRIDPHFSGEFRFVEHGEALVCERMFYDVDSPLLKSPGANVIVCDIQDSWTDIAVYRREAQVSNLPRFVRIAGNVIKAGPTLITKNLEEHLTQVFAGSDIPPGERIDYVTAGIEDFEAFAIRSFQSVEDVCRIKVGGPRFKDAKIGVQRGVMSLSGETLKGVFDPCVSKIIEEINHHVSLFERDSNLKIQAIIAAGEFAENLYFQKMLGQTINSAQCKVVHNDDTGRFGLVGALLSAVYHENEAPALIDIELTRSVGILIGERYNEENSDHRGRKVYRGHGGFDGDDDWPLRSFGLQEELDNSQRSVRRRLIRSLKPPRRTTARNVELKCDIWAFIGSSESKDANAGWAKDEDGQVNPGFCKLCRVEAKINHWEGPLARKYAKTRPADAIELFLVIEFDDWHIRAYIEWKEGEVTRTGPPSILV
ncbi:hypothetical protein CTheo_3026 [Ceratobasidium theobromae]|uniref:Heat shock protein HSP70 n=1 Tax=Ceratobasidium theobromae TaxID=1582974 RepID=A0A5N5QP71_9AGAM|nr:hypothetical protein CTheo_3026 [Ceratobasidium theobromae]